ncbi:PAS domain S-box protein [Solirubrobacter soli]|uniref:PAS domain S-box protein n=1 Tax=Solirubrobacter soli TaxID=363832 RepID=UPI0009FFA66F|nr:PAS domain S-box protein [Solirubrobacter soli]
MGVEEVLGHIPAAVVVVEAGSRGIVYANPRAQRMTAQLGRSIPPDLTEDWEIFHHDGRPYDIDEWPLVRSLTTGEEVVDEEYFNLRADGSRLFVRASSGPIFGDSGAIVGGVLVMTDMTEQKAEAERLTYLAGLLDNTEDAIVAMDERYLLTVWNKGAERLYGWRADEVVGRPVSDVARTNLSEAQRTELRRELAANGRWRGEVTVARKDGTTVDVELISVALRGQQPDITGYLAIHRDISERKGAEEALRAARGRSEAILESISDEFFAVDREWRYTYINERALAHAGRIPGRDLEAADFLTRTVWELFPDLVGSTFDHEAHRALREQAVVELEMRYPVTGRWTDVRVYPSEAGLSVYVHDITERKRAEEELRRRAEQQAHVAELGRRALASDDLQWVLEEAVGLLVRTLGVELACVAELPADRDEVILRAGAGWREGYVGRRFERGRDSQVGYTLLRGEPVIAEDQANDPRFKRSALAGEHGVVSALTVMIESPDEPFGVLEALSTQARSFSPSEVDFVQAVANVLASAVERSRAHKRLLEVLEAERRRIARDLHDEALQNLTHALALAVPAGSAGGPPDELSATLKSVGEQLRAAIYDLRLGGEQRRPFPQLLESLVAAHRAIAVDPEIELDVRGAMPAGPLGAIGTETLRILGEALSNARRHAHARHVRVSVWSSDDALHAEVCDDGRGLDPAGRPARAAGHGIAGMRERAALLHGRLDIVGEPTGTTVRLEVPLRPAQRAAEEVRVLLVEDHTAVREAIAGMFEREPDLTVVGQGQSLAEARELLYGVDVAVLDLTLPDGDGIALIPELQAASPGAQVLVLSANLDRAQTARAVEAGAAGALDKAADLDQVVDAIRRLRAGQTLLASREIAELLRFASQRREQEREDRQAIASLTLREREVLDALAAGLDGQTIADRFGMSIRTERNHVARILTKLGVHTQLQAVLFALRHGFIDES